MSGLFQDQSLSVIIQVLTFKITKSESQPGKRVFLMTPLHHHYEIAGHSEQTIVSKFWISTGILVIIGLMLRPTI